MLLCVVHEVGSHVLGIALLARWVIQDPLQLVRDSLIPASSHSSYCAVLLFNINSLFNSPHINFLHSVIFNYQQNNRKKYGKESNSLLFNDI